MLQPTKPSGGTSLADAYKELVLKKDVGSGITPNQPSSRTLSAPRSPMTAPRSTFENRRDLTTDPSMIQSGFQSTSKNMANKLFNSIDEIHKETARGRSSKYDSQIEKLETEIYELRHKSTDPKAEGVAQQKEAELEKVKSDPEYQELLEDIQIQEEDIAESPVDLDYQLQSQQSEMEENTNWYKYLTQEAPGELGGSLSEIGTQALAATMSMGDQYARKKLKQFILKRAATYGAVAAGGAIESGGIIPLAMGALTAAELTAEAVSIYKMRDAESQAEKAGAFDQRVEALLQRPENQDIDPNTEDGKYRLNKIKQEAREGLDQVYAQNMALGIGDAVGLIGLMMPTAGIVGRLGKFGRTAGKAIRSTGAGRIGSTAAGAYLNYKLEGIEEGTQTGIVAQYVAGKYKDNPSLADNAEEGLDLFSDNAKYAFFGDTPEEYQKTAEYRNAVRSGEILGAGFAGPFALKKMNSDRVAMNRAQKEVDGISPEFLEKEKNGYRADLYTKYFGTDKEEFLFNAIANTIKTSKNPELVAGAKVELVKAKEAQKAYYNLKDTHKNYMSDDHINDVFHNVQVSNTTLGENEKNKNILDLKHVEDLAEHNKRFTDPIEFQGIKKKAELEAMRRNLDVYHAMEEKPSNIESYQAELEDRYKVALESYKDFLEVNNKSDKQFADQRNSIENLIDNRQNTIYNELVSKDLREHVNNLYTKKGALDYINKTTAAETKEQKKFDIAKATTEEYIDYEKGKEAKERLKYRTSKIEKEAFDKDLKSRLSHETLEDVLEDVNANNPRLTKEGSDLLNDLSARRAAESEADINRLEELRIKEEDAEIPGSPEFTQEDLDEATALREKIANRDDTRFNRAYEDFKAKSKEYLAEIPEANENLIKRGIKEDFIKGATAVRDNFAKNSEYSKDKEVQRQIDSLTNLKKIYESREEGLRNSPEFQGFVEKIDENLAALEDIKKVIEKRLADRDARDKRIPGNQAKLILGQLGINPDGTVIESKKTINDNVRKIIGEDVYQSILLDAAGNLTRVHGDVIIQLIKNSGKDKTELQKAIKTSKDETLKSMFAIPRIKAFMPLYKDDGSPATHHFGGVVNAYIKNPSTAFSSVIDVIRDNQGSKPFDNNKESAVYKFVKDLDLIEFITNAEQPREGSVISSAELLEIIEGHNAYNSLFELEKSLNSETNVHVELSREFKQEEKFAKSGEGRVPTPSNQQTVSIRQLIQFFKTPFSGTERFQGFAYMKGFAGTGKTNVVMKWVYLLLGLNPDSIYTAGHNKDSGATIAASLGKTEANDIHKAIADIPNLSEDVKLIILDEAPGVAQDDIIVFADKVAAANKTRKNKLRVIMLGDPNQIIADGTYSSIDDAVTIDGAVNITQISPLTIRYRSDVAPIVDFQDLFIDQPEDLTKTPIHVKSNVQDPSSISSSNVDLLGVNGAKSNFDEETIAILKTRKTDDGRSRAIIVNNDADVAKYEKMLADNGIQNVNVYTVVNSQGKTIDEVYQNVKYDKSFRDMKAYNTALYTASSRATKYLFVGGLPIENSVSTNIEEIAADRAEQNKKRSDSFLAERDADMNVVEKFVKEPATKKELETERTDDETDITTDEEENEDEDTETEENDEEVIGAEEDPVEEIGEPADETYEEQYVESDEGLTPLEADTDDLSDEEGNTQIGSDFLNTPPDTHRIDYPTHSTIAQLKKDGSYSEGVRAGDEVLYVIREVNGERKVVMVSPVGNEKYAEVGVLSTDELLNPPAGFEVPYAKLLADVNNPDVLAEEFRYEKDKISNIQYIQPLFKAKIEYAQRLAYMYNRNPIPLVLDHIMDKFLGTFFKPGEYNRKKVTRTIRVFTKKEIQALQDPKKRTFELPFTPISGIPYLMIGGLQDNPHGKVQLIRLSPAKLNINNHSKYVKPIVDFMNKAREIHNFLDGIEGGDRIRLGSAVFAKMAKAKPQRRQELALKAGMNPIKYEANKDQINKLFDQIDHIVYEHREKDIKTSDLKTIRTNYTVKFDENDGGKPENKFEGQAKVKAVKDGMAVLSNGVTISTKELIRVPVMERFDGDAQQAFHAISLSNPEIEGAKIRTIHNEKVLNKDGSIKEIKKKKVTLSLLSDRYGLTLENLEQMFAFDPMTGESTVNNGFGIRVPISRKDFPSNGKQEADTKVEHYLLDTFDRVLATSINIGLGDSAKKEKSAVVTPTSNFRTDMTKEEFAVSLFPFFNAERSQGGKLTLNVGNNISFDAESNLVPSSVNGVHTSILNGKAEVHGKMKDGSQIGWKWNELKDTLNSITLYNPDGSIRKHWDRTTGSAPNEILSKAPEVKVKTDAEKAAEGRARVAEKQEEDEAFGNFLTKDASPQETQLGVKVPSGSVYEVVKRILPGLSKDEVKIVSEAQMLSITKGIEAWGYFKEGIIYLLEGARGVGQKVLMHEAFHKIFAENFTNAERRQLIGAARRFNPELRTVSKEEVEEWLATQFQNWKNKQGRISLAFTNFFKKLLNILGLYTTNFSNIEQVMTDIDNGILGRKKGEVVYEGRAMLKIREDYQSTRHFKKAKHDVTTTMSKLINSYKFTKDGIVPIELSKDKSNIKAAFPMEFEEALNELNKIIEQTREDYTNALIEPELLSEKALADTTFVKEVYDILSNKRILKELLNSIYPSVYTGSSEFTETQDGTSDDIFNNDQKGISDDAMDADMINVEKSIGPLVKDMLATIAYVEGNALKLVNPRFAFLKLMQGFDNVNTLNFDTMLSQIKEQLGADGNPSVEAIAKRIEDLISSSRTKGFINYSGERKPLTRGMEFASSDKFVYNNGRALITIQKKGKSTEKFVRKVYNTLAKEGMDTSMEEIKAHYDKMKGRTTLASIRTTVGSLRKKNIMVGVKVFENVEKVDGKTVRDKNNKPVIHRTTHYRYNSIRDKGTVQTVRNNIENAFTRNHTNITHAFVSRLEKVKDDVGRIALISEFLEAMHIPFSGAIPKEAIVKTFNDIEGFAKAAVMVNDKLTIETVVQESNERIKGLSAVLSKNNETQKAVSYMAADGTKRYEYTPSSFGVDVFRYLSSGEERIKQNANNFPFLNSAIFKGNPFIGNIANKVNNKIHRYIDHDGIKDKDSKFPAVTYSQETTNDWFSRTFNLGFTAMLENRAEDTEGNRRYVQFAYTPSNKPQIIGNEVDLKSDSEVKLLIEAALEQQRNRPDFDIEGYNKDLNVFKGETVDEVYKHLEGIAEELAQQLVDAKFIPDYKIGQLQRGLVSQYSSKFVADNKLKEGYGVEGVLKLKRAEYNLTKNQILPIVDLFVKNYYMNGYFMNQLMMGDQSFFKNTAEEIKRMSVGFAMGTTGMVNEKEGFMDEKFNVAVSDDIKSTIGEQFSRFKKFYGISFERTDGAAFMTPERYENLIRGFSPEMRIAFTQKPVYYGVDENGIPRAMKYSIVVLSDELCAKHKDLALLREQMRTTIGTNGKPIGEYVFKSGFKVGAPRKRTEHHLKTGKRGWTNGSGNWVEGIRPESIVELDNRNWRIQLNPAHNVEGTISNPIQLTYFANFNGTNRAFADKLYELNAKLIDRGLDKLNNTLGKDGGDPQKIRNEVAKSLGNTEARTYEFLTAKTVEQKDENGNVIVPSKPMIGINFPAVVNKTVTQVGAIVSKATVKIKYPGSKLVLQPDYGVTFKDENGVVRPLKFREGYKNQDGEVREYMEVILPNMYKDQFKSGDFLFESYMGFRIPSTELHSAVPLKVVGFYDSKGTNIVIAPGEICAAHGSDYDIDALFIMRREAHKKDDVEDLLFKGEIVGYNKEGKKIEDFYKKLEKRISEVHREFDAEKDPQKRIELRKLHKQLDGAVDAALKNEVLDTFLAIITHPDNADTMMTPISMARLNGQTNSVKAELKKLGVKVDMDFDLNDPRDEAEIHKSNFSGSILTATLADNVRGLAYGLQSFDPAKVPVSIRVERLAQIPELRAEMLTLKDDLRGETSVQFKVLVKNRIESLEKEHNIEYLTPPINEKNVIEIDGVRYNSLSREEIWSAADMKKGKHLDKDGKPFKVSETLDALINAALDNVKEQILPIINLSNNTAESFIGMLSVGIPINTVSKYMITPLIKEVSNARKYKVGIMDANTKMKALLTEKFLTGDGAITPDELQKLIAEKKVTTKELNKLIVTPLSELTKSQLLLQQKVLKDFAKGQKIGSEINVITKGTKLLKEQPVTQEDIADKMDVFEKIRTPKENPVIGGLDVMSIPHIASAYTALSKLNLIVNNNFYKHRDEINTLAKDISAQLGIRMDYSENKNLRMIRDEISKFVLSSIQYEVDGEVHDFDTSNEPPYAYKNYKQVDKDAVGTDAWNQRFIEKVEELQKKYPDNKFLAGLSISKEFGTGMNRLVYNDANNLEPAEIVDIQDDFKKLMVDDKYTPIQRDFVKYAVLNYGLSFGTTNYTLLLPVDIYTEVSDAMDSLFELMLKKGDSVTVAKRLENISQFIAIQMGVNEIDSLTQAKDFVADGKYPQYGTDKTATGDVHYDIKFAKEKQGILPDTGEEEEQEVDEETLEEQTESTDGVKSASVQVPKGKKLKLPLMIRYFDKAYVRLAEHDADTHIYYREVAKKKYSKHYRSSEKRLKQLMMYGYSIGAMFKRTDVVRSVPKANVKTYSTQVKEKTKIFEVNDKLILKAYDDIAQVDAIKSTISKVTFKDMGGNVVEKAVDTIVEYSLTDSEQLLVIDDSLLDKEDKKDLENFC